MSFDIYWMDARMKSVLNRYNKRTIMYQLFRIISGLFLVFSGIFIALYFYKKHNNNNDLWFVIFFLIIIIKKIVSWINFSFNKLKSAFFTLENKKSPLYHFYKKKELLKIFKFFPKVNKLNSFIQTVNNCIYIIIIYELKNES